MITVYVPDSVADEVHIRQVPVTLEAGLKQAAYAALAADSVAIGLEDGQLLTTGLYSSNAKYEERDGCGVIWGDFDGRSHYFGVVVGPDEAACLRVAHELLKFGEDENEEDDNS